MFTLENQIKAVSLAIKDASRDLVKAKEKGDLEWIQDAQFTIDGLESARESLKSLQSLRNIIQ